MDLLQNGSLAPYLGTVPSFRFCPGIRLCFWFMAIFFLSLISSSDLFWSALGTGPPDKISEGGRGGGGGARKIHSCKAFPNVEALLLEHCS